MSMIENTAAAVDGFLAGTRPSKIAVVSIVLYVVLQRLRKVYRIGLRETAKDAMLEIFRFVRRYFGQMIGIQKEVDKAVAGFAKEFQHKVQGAGPACLTLPPQGMGKDAVLAQAKKLASMNAECEGGQFSGSVYHDFAAGYTEFMNEVMGYFQWTNPLHGGQFTGVRKMEAELVAMTVNMFNGPEGACGTMTSGGTESILMAMKACREYGRHERGITEPELVVPVTAHAAFDKAAHYFGLRIRHARMDPVTCKVDLKHMKSLITSNTIALVGSSPHFPHGIVDDIPAIAAMGKARGIPVHVDACLGGFVVAFMEKAGYPLPHHVDFRVPGVTSISCDHHKYGFACKGSSVVMYRNADLRRHQMFAAPSWPGGVYASPTVAGSRAGNLVAGTWAAMMYHGEAGYVNTVKRVVSTTRWVIEECKKIPGLRVMGEPLVSVIGLASDEFDIYRMLTYLGEKHWELNGLQYPPSIHLCLTLMHTKVDEQGRRVNAERFVNDVREAAAKCMAAKHEPASGAAALYGTSQAIPDRSIIGDVAMGYFDAYYDTKTAGDVVKSV